MTLRKKIFFELAFCFVFAMFILTNSKAQQCPGNWAVGSSVNWGCIYGVSINSNIVVEPTGCPTNPNYSSEQTNTFTFDYPVSSFIIDFRGFSTAAGCGKMEIKINGLFYPLATSNLSDIPTSVGCGGSFSFITLTNEGYITSTNSSLSSSNGHGRIIINGVNATSVTISTNDPAGTIVSAPFNCTTIPLKLETFTGESKNCKASLNWKTGIEFNVKNIEVERSEDGSLFNKVGEVSPKGSDSRYTFNITNISDAFFRLKINDLEGYFEYSEIINIKSSCNKISYEVIPNPTYDMVEVLGLKNNDVVLISDMLGKVVQILESKTNNNKFSLQTLSAGLYIFKVFNDGIFKASLKVIKN